MDVMKAIMERKSIREYKNSPVPEDMLRKVLEAGRMAPTGGNRQELKIIAVRDRELRKKLGEASGGQRHVADAPVVIAAVGTAPSRMMLCNVPAHPVDLSIVVDHMMLAAFELGLGTCWIGAFRQEMVKAALKVPDTCDVVALLTLGFPAADGRPKERKPFDQIVCFDTYKA
jgi:nitroreductase